MFRDSTFRNTFTVEFVGLPGTGKSTVCNELCQVYAEGNLPVWTRVSLERNLKQMMLKEGRLANWGANALYLARRVKIPTTMLAYALSFRPSQHKSIPVFVKRLLRKIYVHSQAAELSGTVLLDQGILQDVWSLSLMRASTPQTHALGKTLVYLLKDSLPDVVVRIEAPPNAVRARLQERYATSGSLGLNEAVLRDAVDAEIFSRALELADTLTSAAREVGTRILLSDGRATPGAQAQNIMAQLREIQRSHQA